MCSMPGGDRGPLLGYGHHIKALNADEHGRFFVDEVFKLNKEEDLANFDIYWFYAKGFDPKIYYFLKEKFGDKKFVFGQNILLDKPDVGASDPWDEWFINEVDFDLYVDQVEYYNNHVKKFLREEVRNKADYLDKCVIFDIDEKTLESKEPEYDCLVYSKKRRYDDNYEEFRDNLLRLLEENNISYNIITYGSYKREEFFEELAKCRCCINMSIDECPGMAMYEAMHMNVPVIGSPHSTPSNFDSRFWVHGTDRMTDKYIKRNEGAAEAYVAKVKEFLDGKLKIKKTPREHVLQHTSYQRYSNDAYRLLEKYC